MRIFKNLKKSTITSQNVFLMLKTRMEKHIGFIIFTNEFHLEWMTVVNENRRMQHEKMYPSVFCLYNYLVLIFRYNNFYAVSLKSCL